jgi:choline dehydrogenase-like flavoprotein
VIYDLSASDSAPLTLTCDVCVIGGGLAGLMTASRLVARLGVDQRVVVLESGCAKPAPEFDALNEVDQPVGTYRRAVDGRVRALGGTSNSWGGGTIPLTAHDMAARDYLGLDAWPIVKAELDQFTPDIERLFGLDQSPYDEPGAPACGLTARWPKIPTFPRRNISCQLHPLLTGRGSPEVWLNATVCDLEIDAAGGRLASVTARSLNRKRLTVNADRFVLAAGTLEATRIMLWLNELTDRRAFCPALGRYFTDHIMLDLGRLIPANVRRTNRIFGHRLGPTGERGLHLESTAAAQREDRAASGYLKLRVEFRSLSAYGYFRAFGKAVQSRRLPPPPKAETIMDFAAVAPLLYWRLRNKQMYIRPKAELTIEARIEQVPVACSQLTLASRRDAFGAPALLVDWRKTPFDLHTLSAVIRRARRYWQATTLKETSPIDWIVDPERDDLLALAIDTCHPAGSARMGLDPQTSVVGPSLACHGVPNVFVASAATFPSSGSANPTLTILQLACRAAESVMLSLRA